MTKPQIARSVHLCARTSALLGDTLALIDAAKAQIARSQDLIERLDMVSRQSVLFAGDGSERLEFLAGEPAPETRDYIELNVFGTQTTRARWLVRGQPFPTTPVGYSWKRARTPAPPPAAPVASPNSPERRFETV
jgi:hypothetical protein